MKKGITYLVVATICLLASTMQLHAQTALTFPNAITSYAAAPDNAALNVTAGHSVTITTWVKTAINSTTTQLFLCKRNSGAGYGYELYQLGAYFAVNATSGSSTTVGIGPAGGSLYKINDGNWHHVAYVLDVAGLASSIYVDGKLDKTKVLTAAQAGAGITNTQPLYFGIRDYPTKVTQINGSMDEVRIYDKAMTAAELVTDMATVVDVNTPSLTAAWNFNEGTGTTLADIKTTNPATITGTVTWPSTTTLATPTAITMDATFTRTNGNVDFSPATNSGAIQYASSNTSVATVVNSLIHIVGVGTTTITATASQPANLFYTAANSVVSATLTVNQPTVPVVSTIASPVYYFIKSASSATGYTDNLLYCPTSTTGVGLKHDTQAAITALSLLDNALWAIVNDAGTLKLKNKGTGLFLDASTTATTTSTVALLYVANTTNPLQYTLKNTGISYALAYTLNNINKQSADAGVNSATEWYFIIDPSATNVAQTISFPTMAVKVVGDAAFAPATASSALAITYTSSNDAVASIVGGKVQINGLGTCIIYANQAGNINYATAPQVSQSLMVATAAWVSLSNAISAATTQMTSAVSGTNPGKFTPAVLSTFTTAIDDAKLVRDNVASTDQQLVDATALLATASVNFTAAVNPVKLSTEFATVWYAIRNANPTYNTKYIKDNGIAAVGTVASFTYGDDAILWKVVADADAVAGHVNIISKNNTQQLTNSTVQSANVLITTTAQTRTIASLGLAQFNINGGTYSVHYNGGNLVGWNNTATNSGSAWTFEEVGLTQLIADAEVVYAANPAGTNPGQFAPANKATFRGAIDAAISLKTNGSATPVQVDAGMLALTTARAAFLATPVNPIVLSTTGSDTWYYIVTDVRASKVMVDNAVAGGAVNFDVKDVNNNKYWRFVAGTVTPTKVMIQNRASGLYFAATPVVSATAGEYNVVGLGQSQFSFNVSGTPLHAQDAGSVIVTWAGGLGSASAWRLEQVAFTPQTITFPAIDSKTRDAVSFDLAATTTASGLTVTYSSSNDLIATVTTTGTVTITATADGFADITAKQVGNAVYAAATPVTNRLVVSGVTSLASGSSKIAVVAKGNMIVVTGTDAQVKAFTTSGVAVDVSKALAQGVYIVKVAGLTTKVAIK